MNAIPETHDRLVRKEDLVAESLIENPVLCLESSLSIHGVGTYNRMRPQVFAEVERPLNLGVGEYIPNKFGNKDIVTVSGMTATTPLRALCEMIIYDRREELILEGLDDLLYEEDVERETILAKADEYEVRPQMERLLELVDDREYW